MPGSRRHLARARPLEQSRRATDRPRGLNVVGYLQAEVGLGEIARRLVAAAKHAGIPTSTLTYRRIYSRQEHRFEGHREGEAPYDTNLICVNADRLPQLRTALGPGPLAGRYTIGVWFWEIARFPRELHPAFDLVDEVWVASEFVRSAIASETGKPVRIVPIPLDVPAPSASDRATLGLPDSFLFLFVFDYFSVFARKNPLGLVDAFQRAFRPGEGPILVIKSINGDHDQASVDRLRRAAADRPDITLWDGYVTPEQRDALMATCDCYVSLHRSEGLGLTMAEAMASGKPVIATSYSGNLTFMTDANSYLVPYALTSIPEDAGPYTPGVEWADPDVAKAAELMRYVYEHSDEARDVGERARADIHERHSIAESAVFLRRRLSEITSRDRAWLAVREPLDHAEAMSSSAPGVALERQHGAVARRVRGLLHRLLWPELAAQRELDSALVEALRALERVARAELEGLSGGSAHEVRMSLVDSAATVIDVGANTGQYARLLRRSGYAGRIVAFEPLSDAFAALSRMAESDPSMECLHAAVGEKAGTATINISENSVSSSLLPLTDDGVSAAPEARYVRTEEVAVVTLDEVSLPREPAFLKIDVQGYEPQVLRGAQRTLEQAVGVEAELSLVPLYAGQELAPSVCRSLRDAGFVPIHVEPAYRDPRTDEILQVDVIFARRT